MIPFAILGLIFLALFGANFAPGLYLTGWDNLHPELDFALNIKRSLFAVWQEYQGLGLLGGMGHASDLPRQILLFFLSLFLPDHWLRQIFFFLMLFLGPLGVYFLLKKKISGLAGALFYLLNLATLQAFYAPFEPFLAHFAFLPWLFLATILFLKNPNRRNGLLFLIINLLAVSQAYVPTLFLVYFVSLISFVAAFCWQEKTLQILKRALLVLSLTLAINAFWLLPFLYFLPSGSTLTAESKMNLMSTEKVYLENKQFGDLGDVLLLKGFWFDNLDFDQSGQLGYMLSPWREHLTRPRIAALGYFLFFTVLFGLLVSLKEKNRFALAFLPLFLLSFGLLANNTPPFSWLNEMIRQLLPFFAQIFRFPFNKFSLLAVFVSAIFFAFGINALVSFVRSKVNFRWAPWLVLLPFLLAMIVFVFPAFRGQLIYGRLKQKIPQEYHQLWQFFQEQPEKGRLANFPQQSFWGWQFYQWGYDGSGFLWYGLENPILDRAFDVWSNFNENYYWEVSYALYSKNQELFEKILEKYQISWLLVDENVISPSSAKALYLDELEEMLANSDKIKLEQNFGKIKIYKVNLEVPLNNFVYLLENPPSVEPAYKWNNLDQAYWENGNYVSPIGNWKLETGNSVYYPFRSLFTSRKQEELEFVVEEQGDKYIFKKKVPPDFLNYSLQIPEITEPELVWVDPQNLNQTENFVPDVSLIGENLEVKVPKLNGFYSAEIDPALKPELLEAKNCNQFRQGQVKNEIVTENQEKFLRQISLNANNCSVSFWLPDLPHNLSYLITIQSRNVQGKSLLFWLENLNSRKADIETYLPKSPITNHQSQISYFIQPPMEKDGLGYTLHFDNISIGQEKSINDLGKITVNQIPYQFLTQLKLAPGDFPSEQTKVYFVSNVYHPNPSFYEISQFPIPNSQFPYLVLSQAYHEGWQAYTIDSKWQIANSKLAGVLTPIIGKKINNHVLVNNWENGWLLNNLTMKQSNNIAIVLVYLPQYLEYLGFFLLIASFLYLLLLTKKKTSVS